MDIKRKLFTYLIPIGVCFLLGFFSSYLQEDAVENWYPTLNRSMLTPPNWVFPLAWSFLYVCMGISIGMIWDSRDPSRIYFARLFFFQLIFNFGWSLLFFYLENPLLGFIDIVLLEMLIIFYAMRAWPRFKWSSYLFIPYILWVAFAAYLNFYILLSNPAGG
ncbi:MAG: tryptophan-rich sensory protein [Tannerellaceae bacterium]|nr:tryptophan-rich sensory protein [Tannerellaceae bacterium]